MQPSEDVGVAKSLLKLGISASRHDCKRSYRVRQAVFACWNELADGWLSCDAQFAFGSLNITTSRGTTGVVLEWLGGWLQLLVGFDGDRRVVFVRLYPASLGLWRVYGCTGSRGGLLMSFQLTASNATRLDPVTTAEAPSRRGAFCACPYPHHAVPFATTHRKPLVYFVYDQRVEDPLVVAR